MSLILAPSLLVDLDRAVGAVLDGQVEFEPDHDRVISRCNEVLERGKRPALDVPSGVKGREVIARRIDE